MLAKTTCFIAVRVLGAFDCTGAKCQSKVCSQIWGGDTFLQEKTQFASGISLPEFSVQ